MISAQTTIQKILNASETYYEIPNFQRPYDWQTFNTNEFLLDLEDSVLKRKNHYFGTVVLVEETTSDYPAAIIDGQQRVTTSLLKVAKDKIEQAKKTINEVPLKSPFEEK